jgi:CelD/BcsL family acetyltransferase involved in cellulose biosynthesis
MYSVVQSSRKILMKIDLIQDPDEFQNLHREWNQLLINSASDVPFLRHEYLTSWWKTRGGGEWSTGKLFILTGRDARGKLQGIAPFFQHQESLLLLGSVEISDFLDLIAPRDQLEAFIRSMMNYLAGEDAPAWNKLDLYNLLEDSPTLPLLKDAAHSRSWDYHSQRLQPAPRLVLPASWEAYLDGLENRYRREIERKIRRAEGYFLPVSWHTVDDPDLLDDELTAFLELMAYHPEKADFLTDTMASQMKKAVHQAFEQGWAQLAFLTVGDIKAAGYLNFDYRDSIWIYNSGLNPMFENLSPGWVLLAYLIQQAIQEGKDAVDFMRGDEPYKYHFGGTDRFVRRVVISTSSS